MYVEIFRRVLIGLRSRGARIDDQIRDLEARVEVLSGDKEERVDLMTLLIRNLLKENKDLRAMLKSMTSFVGEGKLPCRAGDGIAYLAIQAHTQVSDRVFPDLV
jgi:hypothetical protein